MIIITLKKILQIMILDYKLYKGRAESRNAIKLLSFMGYSDEIVKRAQERAEKFVCTGKWQ